MEKMLMEFGKYNLKETCPFCLLKKRMAKQFKNKIVKDILGDDKHESKQCFRNDFIFHTIMNPPKGSKYQEKSDEYWENFADKRFDQLFDMIRLSKK